MAKRGSVSLYVFAKPSWFDGTLQTRSNSKSASRFTSDIKAAHLKQHSVYVVLPRVNQMKPSQKKVLRLLTDQHNMPNCSL